VELGPVTINATASYTPPHDGYCEASYALEDFRICHELELRLKSSSRNEWFEVLRPEIEKILNSKDFYFENTFSKTICSVIYRRQNIAPFKNLADIQREVEALVEHYATRLNELEVLKKIAAIEGK